MLQNGLTFTDAVAHGVPVQEQRIRGLLDAAFAVQINAQRLAQLARDIVLRLSQLPQRRLADGRDLIAGGGLQDFKNARRLTGIDGLAAGAGRIVEQLQRVPIGLTDVVEIFDMVSDDEFQRLPERADRGFADFVQKCVNIQRAFLNEKNVEPVVDQREDGDISVEIVNGVLRI